MRKHRDRRIQLTICLSRIERSTVEPTENVVITCLSGRANLKKKKNRRSPSLAATPVHSPGIARAAVWVGLGAVARSRGIVVDDASALNKKINSFCLYEVCTYMVVSAATKKIRRALCLIPGISHTPPILGKPKYSMDSSRQYLPFDCAY